MKKRIVKGLMGAIAIMFSGSVIADGGAGSKGGGEPIVGCALTMAKDASGGELSLKATTDSASYKKGEFLTLTVTPSEDAYITVIDQGSGDTDRNYKLFSDVEVKGGATYTFPPPGVGKLKVCGSTGNNVFEVIASKEPLAKSDQTEAEQKDRKSKDVNLVPEAEASEPEPIITRCTLSFEITEK
ncbi:MAG: DUF4384 domain-containing protein [Gammaproteobacteria bacterium]|nr:DUF4384 domain-containing protein [Gammaproteobacteria bacterium]MBU1722983.1 DUF4384 domain-containing protein [Gammaproteobacteria bacterium]MBU2007114.1 DUF4384 domain-containing protein [Gammaproteobacteria bacterium]